MATMMLFANTRSAKTLPTTALAALMALALAACGSGGGGDPEPDKCTPTSTRCGSASVLETCNADGLTWTPAACPAATTCKQTTSVFADCVTEQIGDVVETDAEPEVITPICTPKATECVDDTHIKSCAADGKAWVESPCAYKCITEAGKGLCKDKVCEPGSHRCGGSKNLLICKEDGTGFDQVPCPAGAQCNPNLAPEPECEAGPACVVGQKECDETGKFLKTCVKMGTDNAFDWQKCPYGCDADKKACKEAVCQAGDHRCQADDPDAIEECNKTQTGWQFVQKCLTGCKNGLCENKACLQGQERCNYYAVEKCDAAGQGWEFVEGCQGTTCVQEGDSAYCAGCVPGVDFCDGDDVMTCPDASGQPVVKEACAVGETCVEAACVDKVVLSDELGADASLLALAEAVTFCWMNHEGETGSTLCAAVDAGDYSTDVTKEVFIDQWYCDDTIWYDYIYDNFAGGDSDALWQAEGLFSCYEPDNRTVDMKATIPAGSQNEICVFYDTWATPEIILNHCIGGLF